MTDKIALPGILVSRLQELVPCKKLAYTKLNNCKQENDKNVAAFFSQTQKVFSANSGMGAAEDGAQQIQSSHFVNGLQ